MAYCKIFLYFTRGYCRHDNTRNCIVDILLRVTFVAADAQLIVFLLGAGVEVIRVSECLGPIILSQFN